MHRYAQICTLVQVIKILLLCCCGIVTASKSRRFQRQSPVQKPGVIQVETKWKSKWNSISNPIWNPLWKPSWNQSEDPVSQRNPNGKLQARSKICSEW